MSFTVRHVLWVLSVLLLLWLVMFFFSMSTPPEVVLCAALFLFLFTHAAVCLCTLAALHGVDCWS